MTNYEWLKQKIEYLKQHPTDKCVEWPFAKKNGGYGCLVINYTALLAHRVAYVLATGKEPPLNVNHICSNPSCINPNHLYSGSPLENKRDEVFVEVFGIDGRVPSDHINSCKETMLEHRRQGYGFEEPTSCETMKRIKILDLI